MTIDRWLMVALIVCTFIGPLIAPVVGYRIAQPRPIPELKTTIDSNRRRKRNKLGSWLWVIIFAGLSFEVFIIIREATRSTPVTRSSVFLISFAVAGVFFYLLSISDMLVFRTLGRAIDVIEHTIKIMKDEGENIGRLIDHEGVLIDRLTALEIAHSPEIPTVGLRSSENIDTRSNRES